MKARNYAAAYSPAYSPAQMSGQNSKANIDAASAGSYHHYAGSHHNQELPMQSPLYQPPSMGGAAQGQHIYASGRASRDDAGKGGVQSP